MPKALWTRDQKHNLRSWDGFCHIKELDVIKDIKHMSDKIVSGVIVMKVQILEG